MHRIRSSSRLSIETFRIRTLRIRESIVESSSMGTGGIEHPEGKFPEGSKTNDN